MRKEDLEKLAGELAAKANECCNRSDGYEEHFRSLALKALERAANLPQSTREGVILVGTKKTQDYRLKVKPALEPKERHKIEDVLKKLGYKVHGGGTATDLSECDVSFSK
jgi:hypothetical protein